MGKFIGYKKEEIVILLSYSYTAAQANSGISASMIGLNLKLIQRENPQNITMIEDDQRLMPRLL